MGRIFWCENINYSYILAMSSKVSNRKTRRIETADEIHPGGHILRTLRGNGLYGYLGAGEGPK